MHLFKSTWLLLRVSIAAGFAAGGPLPAQGAVTTYPVPREIDPSPDYAVRAGGKAVFVYQSPAFSMATFAVSGGADVVVEPRRPIRQAVVRPLSRSIQPTVEGQTVRFRIPGPCHLAVEIDEDLRRPLFLFANAPEERISRPREPGMHYFEGGRIHDVGRIDLKDRETIYLAGGAIVRGVIRAQKASHARICGPGILDASTRTTQAKTIQLENCTDIDISGIIVMGSYGWTIVPRLSENIRLRNVKILGWRDNDDGCDPDSSRHVTVENCFFRTKDDCIAVKSHDNSGMAGAAPVADPSVFNVDDVRVANSIFWSSEWGHALTVGFAIRGPVIRNVVFAHCDIIKKEKGPSLSIDNHDLGAVEGVRFEDIRVEDGCDKLLAVKVAFSEYSADCPFEYYRNNPARRAPQGDEWLKVQEGKRSSQRGTIHNIVFKDIEILGDRLPDSEIRGFSARKEVSDVVLENIRFKGKALKSLREANLRIRNAADVRMQ